MAVFAQVADALVANVDQGTVVGFNRGANVERADAVGLQIEEIRTHREQTSLQPRTADFATGNCEIDADAGRHRAQDLRRLQLGNEGEQVIEAVIEHRQLQ